MIMTLENMLADGCSRKFGSYFLGLMEREKEMGVFDEDFLNWCHSNG